MVMAHNQRHMGRFSIDADMIEGPFHDREAVRAIMDCCVIVRADMDYSTWQIHYVALSSQFGLVNEGDNTPAYRWLIERFEPLGQVTARAEWLQ